jgi:N-hydroxyarylamine O-acetyltransferase
MAGEEYVVQVKIRVEWVALYRFDLQEQFMSDFEVGNWYTSTYPTAHFVNELMAARADSDCRHALSRPAGVTRRGELNRAIVGVASG